MTSTSPFLRSSVLIRSLRLLCLLLSAGNASAQTADLPVRRLEIDLGGGWLGRASAGEADAELLANNREPQAFALFAADGRFAGSGMFQARAGTTLNRRFAVEGGVVISRPSLEVSTSADVEGGPSITIVERIDQYFFEGSVLILIDEVAGPRTVPYAVVGGGYLRQLHEGRTVIEHGQLFHAGGGLKHWLRADNSGRLRGVGVRADARLYLLVSGAGIGDGPRPHLAATGSVFLAF